MPKKSTVLKRLLSQCKLMEKVFLGPQLHSLATTGVKAWLSCMCWTLTHSNDFMLHSGAHLKLSNLLCFV